ncbi:MAG: hypothetical protein IKS68_03145 [Mailhella sp.]|nr:hypothetical protein [Mailhella sp.]
MIEFLSGPLFKLSLLIFFIGLAVRIVLYVRGLDAKLERVAYAYMGKDGVIGGAWSVFKWLVPFGTHSWRKQGFATFAFFLFHLGVVICPLFLAGHMVLLEGSFGFSLPSLPVCVGDAFALLGFGGGIMLLLRRIALPEVRFLSDWKDYAILGLCIFTVGTGMLARFQIGCYDLMLGAHMLSGELILILAPFTKLSHIALFFASRAQLGIDYAVKRGGASRGPAFPW